MKKLFLSALTFLLLYSSLANATTIHAVKDNKVLINLEGANVEIGDEFFAIDAETKKRSGILRISQVKPNKALGVLLKGRASRGQTLQAKARSSISADVTPEMIQKGTTPTAPASSGSNGGYLRVLKSSYGILGGLSSNSMSANVSYNGPIGLVQSNVDMKGNGLAVGGFYDYIVSSDIIARGYVGLDQFSVKGTSNEPACQKSKDCNAEILYLATYGHLKWYPMKTKMRPWVGAGLGYLLAVSKSSNALKNVSSSQVMSLAGGLDIQRSRREYIPISLEYTMYPPSSTVKAGSISIRAGWGWNF